MIGRREWMLAAGAAAVPMAASAQRQPVKIGVELGCISANKWTPYQFLDYFHRVGIDVAQFNSNTLGVNLKSPDEAELKKIRAYAANLGVQLSGFSGGSICPTSKGFNAKQGTAEEQIAGGLKICRIIGASAMRVVLGSATERPEIAKHVENLTLVLKTMRSRILDSGVKLGIENHNGDQQAREIKDLIEHVGSDILGVCLDSGNPLLVYEDPHLTLELLGPYAVTTHIRDTAVWRVPDGVAMRWVNMGEGNVDIDGWIKKFVVMRPGMAVTFENLPSAKPRIIPIFEPRTFEYFQKMPAADLARYLALAERGKAVPAVPPAADKSRGRQQCEDLEVCVRYTKKLLAAI